MSLEFSGIEVTPFPSDFTAPTSCFATDNYYFVEYGDPTDHLITNLYGTPTLITSGLGTVPSGDCFPTDFETDRHFLTDGDCPGGYTRACATGVGEISSDGYEGMASRVTCCPSVTDEFFSFSCQDDNTYGCRMVATEGDTWTGTITNLRTTPGSERPITHTPTDGQRLEAWGIKMLSIPTTSDASSSAPSGGETDPGDEPDPGDPGEGGGGSGGLSTGAIAGIVVGVVLGLALLAAGAFFLWRKKRSSGAASVGGAGGSQMSAPTPKSTPGYYAPTYQEEANYQHDSHYGGHHTPQELDTAYGGRGYELEAQGQPVELPPTEAYGR